jgi:two-component system sensor histidine kinase KdpD
MLSARQPSNSKRVAHHQVQANIPMNYPLVPMDFTLIVQVLVNVLENAVKYSPENSLIEISADLPDGKARLQIADRGVGIPSDDLTRVFDKFYRAQRRKRQRNRAGTLHQQRNY